MNLKKLFLYLLIASVGISALIGIGVILIGNFGEFERKILATTVTVTVTSILGLSCGAYLETTRGRNLPLAGVAFAILAAGLWMIIIWYRGEPIEWFMKTTVTATILAVACSHLSMISLARLEKKFLWAYFAAHGLVWSLAGSVILFVWFEPENYEQLIGRTLGVLAILVASITILTPVFHKLSATEPTAGEIDKEIDELRAKIANLEAKKAELTHPEPEAVLDQLD